jgi:hypothetical protein
MVCCLFRRLSAIVLANNSQIPGPLPNIRYLLPRGCEKRGKGQGARDKEQGTRNKEQGTRKINCESTFLRHSKFLVRYSAVHVGLKPAKDGIAGLSATDFQAVFVSYCGCFERIRFIKPFWGYLAKV